VNRIDDDGSRDALAVGGRDDTGGGVYCCAGDSTPSLAPQKLQINSPG
jgi:hypothetical protein